MQHKEKLVTVMSSAWTVHSPRKRYSWDENASKLQNWQNLSNVYNHHEMPPMRPVYTLCNKGNEDISHIRSHEEDKMELTGEIYNTHCLLLVYDLKGKCSSSNIFENGLVINQIVSLMTSYNRFFRDSSSIVFWRRLRNRATG